MKMAKLLKHEKAGLEHEFQSLLRKLFKPMFEKIKHNVDGQQALTVLVSWLVFYLRDTDVMNYIYTLDPDTCFKDL